MIKIDLWYGDKLENADRIDIFYYANDGIYRGNIYKAGRAIGDYETPDSLELPATFNQLTFNFD